MFKRTKFIKFARFVPQDVLAVSGVAEVTLLNFTKLIFTLFIFMGKIAEFVILAMAILVKSTNSGVHFEMVFLKRLKLLPSKNTQLASLEDETNYLFQD